eukprot:453152-Amphidinium_carterae.1
MRSQSLEPEQRRSELPVSWRPREYCTRHERETTIYQMKAKRQDEEQQTSNHAHTIYLRRSIDQQHVLVQNQDYQNLWGQEKKINIHVMRGLAAHQQWNVICAAVDFARHG